ncbi:hypothetical protein ACVGOW_19670 [Pseudonocardia saturnea]
MTTTPTTQTAPTASSTADLAAREVTESDTRAHRLAVLEAQVCEVREEVGYIFAGTDDPDYSAATMRQLATLLQHTLQELAHLAREVSPR